jgi:hypothetical protein
MSSWRARDRALTGADCFMRAFDVEARRFHGAGHLSQLVLRLGPGFDADAFRTLIADVTTANPIVRAPVRRRFGIAPPAYRLALGGRAPLPRLVVHDDAHASGDSRVPSLLRQVLNARLAIERGELLRFDAVRYAGGGTDLAITWAHLLLDGAGSEQFVRRLHQCFHGATPSVLGAADRSATVARHPLAVRTRLARAWQAHLVGFGAAPPRSLAGPRRRVTQALDYDVVTLSRAETRVVVERAAAVAGALTPALFYLAATMRAHDAVFAARGADPGHYLVPLPVNLRPRGAPGAVFRTNVGLLWFHVARRHVGDLPGLVAELARQRRAGIRAGLLEASTAAMDLLRWAPARLHTWIARRGLGGEIASFYFAFTGEFLAEMTTFCGAEIANGFHAPSVMPSPGSGVIMSVREGRLNIAHIYQQDAVTADERGLLRARLLDELQGHVEDARALEAAQALRDGTRLRSSA